jgi:hypothetical protein
MLSNYWMTVKNELEWVWKEALDDICLDELSKTMKGVSQDSQCLIQNSNQAPM